MSRKSHFSRANLNAKQVTKAVEGESVKKRHINNEEPLEFPRSTESGFLTTHELADDINKVMENLFQDYYGAIVSVIPTQTGSALRVDLYFKPTVNESTDDSIKAFVSLQSAVQQGGTLLDRVRSTNRAAVADRHFELTAEAAEYLYDFLHEDVQKQIDWARPETFAPICTETVEQQQFGSVIYCSLNVDIYKLLGFLYGNKENNQKRGSKLTYNIVPVRPANGTIDPTIIGANWILQLSVMSYEAWEKIMNKVGINFNQGRTPIVVSRRNRT